MSQDENPSQPAAIARLRRLRVLPPDLVARDQRRRLRSAAARGVAERGYGDLTVAHLVSLAGISRATFYERFDNKLDCVRDAQRAALDQLQERIETAARAESRFPAQVAAGLGAAFGWAESRPRAARLATLDAVAGSPDLADAVVAFHELLAALLAAAARSTPEAARLPAPTERFLVGGVAAVASRGLAEGGPARLRALEPELLRMLLIPYLGIERSVWSVSRPGAE